ncbi:hypothetical protein B0H12DRAFT_1136435 [Mycena haematopus]|nr:hypothetical protein B0H12DRAFT_1136435 [Mycena haematopus]
MATEASNPRISIFFQSTRKPEDRVEPSHKEHKERLQGGTKVERRRSTRLKFKQRQMRTSRDARRKTDGDPLKTAKYSIQERS